MFLFGLLKWGPVDLDYELSFNLLYCWLFTKILTFSIHVSFFLLTRQYLLLPQSTPEDIKSTSFFQRDSPSEYCTVTPRFAYLLLVKVVSLVVPSFGAPLLHTPHKIRSYFPPLHPVLYSDLSIPLGPPGQFQHKREQNSSPYFSVLNVEFRPPVQSFTMSSNPLSQNLIPVPLSLFFFPTNFIFYISIQKLII